LDHAIFDFEDAIEDVECAVIMRDDEDACVALVGDFRKELHHLAAAMAVERGGGFVGEDEAGLVRESAGDGDTLLFAAGEGDGEIARTGADAEVVEQFQGAFARGFGCGVVDFEGDLHVLQSGEKGDEIGLLKNEAQVLAAKARRSTSGRGPSSTGVPLMVTWPLVGGLISAMAVRMVDFPEPLGPSMPTASPRAICSVASRMAMTSVWPLPYTLRR